MARLADWASTRAIGGHKPNGSSAPVSGEVVMVVDKRSDACQTVKMENNRTPCDESNLVKRSLALFANFRIFANIFFSNSGVFKSHSVAWLASVRPFYSNFLKA